MFFQRAFLSSDIFTVTANIFLFLCLLNNLLNRYFYGLFQAKAEAQIAIEVAEEIIKAAS